MEGLAQGDGCPRSGMSVEVMLTTFLCPQRLWEDANTQHLTEILDVLPGKLHSEYFLGNSRSIEYFFGDGTGGTSEWQKLPAKKAMTKIFGFFEIRRKFPEMGRF